MAQKYFLTNHKHGTGEGEFKRFEVGEEVPRRLFDDEDLEALEQADIVGSKADLRRGFPELFEDEPDAEEATELSDEDLLAELRRRGIIDEEEAEGLSEREATPPSEDEDEEETPTPEPGGS